MQGPVNGETEPPSVVASSAIVQSVQQESFKVGGLINVKQNFMIEVSLLLSAARQMVFTSHKALQTELLHEKSFPLHGKSGQATLSPQPVNLLGC